MHLGVLVLSPLQPSPLLLNLDKKIRSRDHKLRPIHHNSFGSNFQSVALVYYSLAK